MEKIKWALAVIGGAMSAFCRKYALIIVFVGAVVILDTITGLIKAKVTGEKISSKKGAKGFWKKIALFAGLLFGFFLDAFIPYLLLTIGVELPISTAIFGMIIGCYIVINESISIAENLYAANPEILPGWIKKLLTSAKDQIDKKTENSNNKA